MNPKNICIHVRVVKRLSDSVADESHPTYEDSALYFFHRNEELWGRNNEATILQESIYALDSLQAALPSNSQLRNAAENLHILLLRGYRPFGSIGRAGHTQEVARALAMYSSFPDVVIPHLERYQEQLKPYASLRPVITKTSPKGSTKKGKGSL